MHRRSTLRKLVIGSMAASLIAVTATAAQAATTPKHPKPARTATLNEKFHGMNWADNRDNFLTEPIIPNGLSTSDTPAVTYVKSRRILQSFKTNFKSNTVRLAINPETVSSTWWKNYTQIIKAATDLKLNVILGNWGTSGDTQFKIPNITNFYTMWDAVVKQYKGKSNVYYEPFNEPGGYTDAEWVAVAEGFVAHFNRLPRNHILIDGTGWAQNLAPIGSDPKLAGTLLSIHIYSIFGRSHLTEADWIADFKDSLAGYGSRAIVSEFGVPTRDGVNYNGPRDGDNNVSYFYAVTDTVRELGLGTVYWEGVNPRDGLALEANNDDYTEFPIINQSAVDRLNHAWGRDRPVG